MKAQVCIIGSGVAGSTVAETLLDAGVTDVVMVECGAAVPMRDSRIWHDAVLASDHHAPLAPMLAPFTLPQALRVPPLERARYAAQDTEETGAYRFDPTIRSYLARGGSTVGWDGWCFRFMPEDFKVHSRTGSRLFPTAHPLPSGRRHRSTRYHSPPTVGC
jgi:choline dehydrogenase-like flavoprotein